MARQLQSWTNMKQDQRRPADLLSFQVHQPILGPVSFSTLHPGPQIGQRALPCFQILRFSGSASPAPKVNFHRRTRQQNVNSDQSSRQIHELALRFVQRMLELNLEETSGGRIAFLDFRNRGVSRETCGACAVLARRTDRRESIWSVAISRHRLRSS